MQVVHSIYREEKPKKEKRMSEQERRVDAWMARFHERQYQKALKINADIIKEIQKYEPGWMPER